MPDYPSLPTAPPDEPENPVHWGSAVVRYVLAHNLTATLSDTAIEQGIAVSTIAVAPRALSTVALDRIVAARWQLVTTLHRRQHQQLEAQGNGGPAGRDTPKAGPMAPLHPVPESQPPAGNLANGGRPDTSRIAGRPPVIIDF